MMVHGSLFRSLVYFLLRLVCCVSGNSESSRPFRDCTTRTSSRRSRLERRTTQMPFCNSGWCLLTQDRQVQFSCRLVAAWALGMCRMYHQDQTPSSPSVVAISSAFQRLRNNACSLACARPPCRWTERRSSLGDLCTSWRAPPWSRFGRWTELAVSTRPWRSTIRILRLCSDTCRCGTRSSVEHRREYGQRRSSVASGGGRSARHPLTWPISAVSAFVDVLPCWLYQVRRC